MKEKEIYYVGGIVNAPDRVKVYKDGGLISKEEQKTLAKHSEHHSKKHIKEMKKDMKMGFTFKEAHKKAMEKVGE
tara:strand:+ start:175 stop:399 length:225 start_codon:yes stop_codon:yes gene_type:complete